MEEEDDEEEEGDECDQYFYSSNTNGSNLKNKIKLEEDHNINSS